MSDGRTNTSIRIPTEGLRALKMIAAEHGVIVNDLLLQGAEMVLSLYGTSMTLRKERPATE